MADCWNDQNQRSSSVQTNFCNKKVHYSDLDPDRGRGCLDTILYTSIRLYGFPSVGSCCLTNQLIVLVACIPIQSQWYHSIQYSCINVVALFTAAVVTDVVTDCK